MTRDETTKVLALLKAAYPNSYKGMTKEEAMGTISIWTMQFESVPVDIMLMAINRLISNKPFPPAISWNYTACIGTLSANFIRTVIA